MAKRGKILIEREKCKGCALCVEACPFEVIEIEGSSNSWGYYPAHTKSPERCTACGSCFTVCPDTAITVFEITEGGEK
jgi:2-oxoglutarate ferredoxin oxidoreductase subunit delta